MGTATEEIERTAQEYATAWSAGGSQAAAAFFTEDAVRVDVVGDVQHGRSEIAAALEALVHRTLSAPKISFGVGTVRMLTPEQAIWRGSMDITTTDGSALKGNAVLMMKMDSGRWLILEAHPKLYPLPPSK